MVNSRITFSMLFTGALAAAAANGDLPINEAHTLRAENDMNLRGAMVTLHTRSKQPFRAYASGAKNADHGLLLVHEWWGLTEHIKAEADYWAARGYRVIAPDLYGGEVAGTSREAARLMQDTEQYLANSKMAAVLERFAQQGMSAFALGWCFGGGQVLQAAIAFPERVAAVAMYYGRPETKPGRLARLQSPLLGIWATRDGWITPQRVEDFARALEKAGSEYEFHHFDAGHAFANPSGDHYDSALAREARRLTGNFFKQAQARSAVDDN